MDEQYDIFISYSRHDEKLIDPLAKLLRVEGRNVFRDVDNVEPGDRWNEKIDSAVMSANVVLIFWCCHSGDSKWVEREISLAVGAKRKLIPIILCGNPLPESIEPYQWIDFRGFIKHECSAEHGSATQINAIDPTKPLVPGDSEVNLKPVWHWHSFVGNIGGGNSDSNDFDELIKEHFALRTFTRRVEDIIRLVESGELDLRKRQS